MVIRIAKRLGFERPGLRHPQSQPASTTGSGRRLGHPTSPVAERRGEILSATYGVATLGAIAVWAVAPGQVLNDFGVGIPIGLAGAAAAAFFVLRRHLPRYAEDVAVVASLALLGVGIAYMREAAIFTPYYVWVGFSAPLWFPPRRAVGYLGLTTAACGADMLLAGTAAALASWFATVAILVIAFVIVLFLTRALVDQGRLAAMGEMTLVMGHEIRNPLSVITNAHWLLDEAVDRGDTASAKRQIQLARHQTARVTAVAEDLLTFAQDRPAAPEPVDLGQLVDDVLVSLPPPSTVRIERNLPPLTLEADDRHMHQVLINVMSNAYQAIPEGGSVCIQASMNDGHVIISVEDSGVGFDPVAVPRAFEPFFSTKVTGTGLGLTIVKRLIDANGGTVSVENRPEGGARVQLTVRAVAPSHRASGHQVQLGPERGR